MIKTIIFDWDGTIHNTKKLYGKAFRAAYQMLVDNGMAKEHYYSDDDVAVYLGLAAPEMWKIFMPDLPEEWKEKASQKVGEEMIKIVYSGNAILYDGAEKMLDELKSEGYKLVFLSNCRHAYMEAHREVFKLDTWFDAMYCCEDFGFAPKEEVFKHFEKDFEGEFVAVGDRMTDMNLAKANGLKSIGCLYGFGQPEEFEGASAVVKDISEITECICKLCAK